MKLDLIAAELGLRKLTPELEGPEIPEVSGAYVSDLLSDVLAHAPTGGLLVTVQAHINVIAVAVHAGLAGVVFAQGRCPEPPVIDKAREENIRLYVSRESAFEVAGKLYALGLRADA